MLIPKFKAMRDGIKLMEHDLFGKPVSTFPDHAPAERAHDEVRAQSGGNVRRFVLQCNIKVRSYSAVGGTVKIATKTLQWRSFPRMVSLVDG